MQPGVAITFYTVSACVGKIDEPPLTGQQYAVVIECFYVWAQLFLKVSVGILFLRLMPHRWERTLVVCVITFSIILYLGFFNILLFQCGKPGVYLLKYLSKKCLPDHVAIALTYTQAAISLATDLIYALVPIFLTWNLHVNKRTKFSVFCILGLAAM